MKKLFEFTVVIGISALAGWGSWVFRGPVEEVLIKCDPSLLKDDEICIEDVPDGVLWIDARSRREWEENGLSGSVIWNMDPSEDAMQMEAEAAMAIINAELVVIYCKSESCGTSRQIADLANTLKLGPPIKVLFGGWEAIKGSSLAR